MTQYAPCPKCGSPHASPVSFTLWGGLLGPKLLTHVQCGQCRTCYNGKTGQSNTMGIIVYTIVVSAISIAILGALFLAMR